jgi:hypothetical protein
MSLYQKQKNKINSQEGSLNGTHHNEQYENIKTLLPKQRIKTIEHEVLKQDSKMNLLSDKVMDMKIEFTLSGSCYFHVGLVTVMFWFCNVSKVH